MRVLDHTGGKAKQPARPLIRATRSVVVARSEQVLGGDADPPTQSLSARVTPTDKVSPPPGLTVSGRDRGLRLWRVSRRSRKRCYRFDGAFGRAKLGAAGAANATPNLLAQ